jgi:hypothetical protein
MSKTQKVLGQNFLGFCCVVRFCFNFCYNAVDVNHNSQITFFLDVRGFHFVG